MATTKDYLAFLLDQLSGLDGISHRRMMGEYIIYHRGKIAAFVCDNRLLVKQVPSALRLMPDAERDSISGGGKKNMLLVDQVDDKAFLTELFSSMYDELPEAKLKQRKKTGAD